MYLIGLLYRSFRAELTGLLDRTTEPLPEGAAAGGSGILTGLLYRLYGKTEKKKKENLLNRMDPPEAHPAVALAAVNRSILHWAFILDLRIHCKD